MPLHGDITDAADLHVPGVVATSDPGAVGAYKVWVDTGVSGSPSSPVVKIRNSTNAGWVVVTGAVTDAELLALAGLTSAADKVPRFTGVGTADLLDFDTDGTLAANSDTRLASQKAIKTYVGAQIGTTGIAVSLIDAKGDLVVGTANDAVARLVAGANGTVLTADSAQSTGLKWATPASTSEITPDTPLTSSNAADDEGELADNTTLDTAGTRFSGATAWADHNKGTATYEYYRGAIVLRLPTGQANPMELRGATQAVPSVGTDFLYETHAILGVDFAVSDQFLDWSAAGIGLRESGTSKVLWWTVGVEGSSTKWQVRRLTNDTTWPANPYSRTFTGQGVQGWLRIGRTGTTIQCSVSVDQGHSWNIVYSESQTTSFTTAPDQVGLFGNARNAQGTTAVFRTFRRVL